MSLDNILNYCSLASGVLPVIVATYTFKNLDRVLKTAAIFFFISIFFDLLLLTATELKVRNNSPFIHFFMAVSMVFWGLIYYHAFHIPLLKKITIILGALCLAAIGYNAIKELMFFPTLSYTVLSVVLNVLSLLYFYQLLNIKEFTHIEKQPMFWINAGVLFYFGINIFLFMLFERIVSHRQGDIWLIHDVTNIIANVLYSVGLLCKIQRTT
jgi:hypothetical protein